jgi:hypothetical protein
MCGGDLFGGGGGGGNTSSTTSSTTNETTQVQTSSTVNVPISVDTADLADALKALAGSNLEGAALTAAATAGAAKTAAAGQIASAAIAAGQGPSWSTIIIVAGSILGVLVTLHVIKVRGFK